MSTLLSHHVDAVARTVLYEGYILWPYRRSALKNQRRWTFGGVYPEAYCRTGHPDDACLMRTECLLASRGETGLTIRVRFLHVVDRRIARAGADGLAEVDALSVNGTRYVAWQEAAERELVVRMSCDDQRTRSEYVPIAIPAGEEREALHEATGELAGVIIRAWDEIRGSIDVSTEPAARGIARVGVAISNHSAWNGESRERVLKRTCVSTHVVLQADEGEFVSLTDPPPPFAELAARCHNVGTWPVLVGEEPDRHTMLSSPIILPDYPQVAPESGGDFFDAAEIDQLLVLSILSMTEEEQRAMCETDPRAREILERCRAMSPDDFVRLHGATRELRAIEVSPGL